MIHHTEQTELNRLLEQDNCDHNFQYQGALDKYFSYFCTECGKVYWVNRHDNHQQCRQKANGDFKTHL